MASSHPKNPPRLALVTGASSGIGAAFATRLARDGYGLIVVARRGDRLEELAAKLRAQTGVQVEVLVADLARATDLHKVETRITQAGALDLLVNNAGFGVYKPLVDGDPDVLEEMILVNVLALTRLTRAALPGMVSRGSGSIINVSSGLAFMPSATWATYSGTKAYVVNFTRSLTEEVSEKGIRVQALCPGITLTEFHRRSGTDLSRIPPHMLMTAEEVADASLAGLELGEVICLPGLSDEAYIARFEEAQSALTRNMTPDGKPAARYRKG